MNIRDLVGEATTYDKKLMLERKEPLGQSLLYIERQSLSGLRGTRDRVPRHLPDPHGGVDCEAWPRTIPLRFGKDQQNPNHYPNHYTRSRKYTEKYTENCGQYTEKYTENDG